MNASRLSRDHIDWCVDPQGKLKSPFYFHVSRRPNSASTSQTFPFLLLPDEIQLEVYRHCDASTLYQLMKTCRHMRPEATELFWADTET
ncbi:hypothetical protein BT63DRAFT_435187, partial [Microthyrium microscopicum]